MDQSFPSYVNIPPLAKTRSTSHLAPTVEHHRSVSYEETTTASTSTDSVPSVRIRSEHSQASIDSPIPAPRQYVAAYEYQAQNKDELDLTVGSIVHLVTAETHEDGWFCGELNGKVGLFPSNYARLMPDAESYDTFRADDIRLPDEGKTLDDFQIGHGATATVFKVDLRMKRKLDNGSIETDHIKGALKRFNKHLYNTRGDHMSEKEQLEQLKREANLVNGLSHNNIVRLLGICLEDPYFGLLLELCEGSSLRTVCRSMHSDSEIPLGVLVDWARQVAEGMQYLISEGYVHRDLKADNVLVKEEVCFCMDQDTMKYEWCTKCGRRPLDKLQLKITDFGVTRKMTADANRFSTAGTYAWLAPEAFRDGTWSEASDVWSYGVVLWELLSMEDPYQGQIPATIAFQIVMRGQSLVIDDKCPTKWKEHMQSCWSLDPHLRPKFEKLAQDFREYANELKVENSNLQRGASKMVVKSIYTECMNHKEVEDMFHALYSKTDVGDINRKKRTSIAPETKARKGRLMKGRKLEITGPVGDVLHVMSVQKDKGNDKLKINYNDENYNGGTLPRLSGRQSSLSLSSPDLYQIKDIFSGSNTVGPSAHRISRKNAIRHKKTHPNGFDPHMISPTLDESNSFAKIDNADDVNSSQAKEKKGGTLSRAWAKLPWKNSKRDSKEDHDERATAGSISSRSSSTTSSNRIITGQATRGAAALPFLEAGARSRAQSAADSWDDSNSNKKSKTSPTGKGPVKQTNLTERFVKDSDKDSVMRPAHLPNSHRKSALDQTIPASPNSPDSLNFPPMHVSSRRTTANSSSDGATSYEQLVNHHGAGHGHRNPIIHPTLSDYVPTYSEEQTHYEMGPRYFDRNGHGHGNQVYGHISTPNFKHSQQYYPVGGGCDSYIPISPKVVVKPTVGEVNNAPYSDNFRLFTRNVQNPEYIPCKQNQRTPARIPAVPIKIQSESNLVNGLVYSSRPDQLKGIGNGTSSLSLSEVPDILAPPPPRVSMSPPTRLAPVLPPRDGSLSPDPRGIMDKEILKQTEVVGPAEIF